MTAPSGGTLRVRWSAPSDNGSPISGYDVDYGVSRRGLTTSFRAHSFSGTGTVTTIRGLRSNTTYQVRVRAENAVGDGAWSEPGSGTTWRAPPGRVSTPGVWPGGLGAVRVTWSAPTNRGPRISDYDVGYREEGSGAAYMDAGYNGTGRETTITGLTNGTSYEVQVRARNADGSGAWSSPPGVGTAGLGVEFGAAAYTASEGGADAAVMVTLNEDAVAALSIPITGPRGRRRRPATSRSADSRAMR